MSLTEAVHMLTGASWWRLASSSTLGLRSLVLADGPAGVRGEGGPPGTRAICFPAPICQGSTWDTAMIAELGRQLAGEAHRCGVDVVLAPLANLQRSVRAGRFFEYFSEDPLLTGDLVAAEVSALQAQGIGACVKHYVCANTETDALSMSVWLDQRALREVYLAPFERAVRDAGAWMVMCAYSGTLGTPMTHSPLIREPLQGEWGFNGVTVSDWGAAQTTVESALAGLDLIMPGPRSAWGEALEQAVLDGQVPRQVIDDKLARHVRLHRRVQRYRPRPLPAGTSSGTGGEPDDDPERFARFLAADGTVLLRNDGILPLAPGTSVAMIGYFAHRPRVQGGGSASLMPPHRTSLTAALQQQLGAQQVHWTMGQRAVPGIATLSADVARDPASGRPGIRVEMRDAAGTVTHQDVREYGSFAWIADAVLRDVRTITASALVEPAQSGTYQVGFRGFGEFEVLVNGALVRSVATTLPRGIHPAASFAAPPQVCAPVHLEAGEPALIEVRHHLTPQPDYLAQVVLFSIGIQEPCPGPAEELRRAVDLAASHDVAVVVVGSPERETEGADRDTIDLPEPQNALVHAVMAANPRTIVVVDAGAPLVLPWMDEVSAVVVPWLGGEQMGQALAAVLTGDAEPGGRLTCTWPAAAADVPSWQVEPVDGVLEYREGIHIGYREWLRRQALGGPSPAAPFGFGLGYTTFTWSGLEVDPFTPDAGTVAAHLTVTNTGGRAGKEVVQLYLSKPDSQVERPVRWLAGFGVARCAPGESARLTIEIPRRALEYWQPDAELSPATPAPGAEPPAARTATPGQEPPAPGAAAPGRWILERGTYLLSAARDCEHLESTVSLTLP